VVNNMFKQNIKKRNKNKLMSYRRKKTNKKTIESTFVLKRMACAQEEKMRKVNIGKVHRITKYRI